ncbi:MAG: SURF1 family protein, partial [Gammaproteobacteria bacterium]|nr:SURF1 family protein [Gammaproteobacteria bacterium]MBU1832610.1 SURF1 family protein [Gammaproteobacteria bacterium]
MPARLSLKNGVIGIAGILAFAGFIALGNWQLERRHWKLDLIQRVAERVHATPVMAPNVEHWPTINKAHDEYRRVSV